ncbi:hypothetical protein E3Q10_02192 [Wallemia mellicola]|uniref:IMS import disulfide relay-system CHCH-CHCH-like Cx9C domain-containing protein n=1 Tax=Wallemia mellicola TaxID=1708541 RepID=A0A4T0QY30_9BASI|nr:hypothetical protein E3Q10_02192 [Wallemia mellicola]
MLQSKTLQKATQPRSTNSSPIAAMSKATAACAPVAKAYGTCVASSYEDITRGACQSEFEAFKNCVTKTVRFRFLLSFLTK